MTDWNPAETAPENVLVITKLDDQYGARNEQRLIRFGRLWFVPDKSMYVYYTPTHWRPDVHGECRDKGKTCTK